jgi:Ca-activated chloride channel family protein
MSDLLARIGAGGLWAAAHALTTSPLKQLTLEQPWWLLALVVLPWLAVVLLRTQARPVLRFARGDDAAALPVGRGVVLRIVAHALLLVTVALVVVTLAKPQLPGEPDPATTEGIDIVVALDISGSMRAADFRPNDRLFVAKQVIEEHLLTRKRDRIGLVVFAGEAFTQAPLTHDKRLLHEILEGVRTGVITDGTAIGDGIATATNRLRDSTAKTRVIILVTDGDNNAGVIAPETAVDVAHDLGIQLYPILIGRGGRVPYPAGTDPLGQPRYEMVEIPVDATLLKSLAQHGGGTFFNATDAGSLSTSFQHILESLDRSKLDGAPAVRKPIDLYPLALFPAVLLLALATALLVTRGSTLP